MTSLGVISIVAERARAPIRVTCLGTAHFLNGLPYMLCTCVTLMRAMLMSCLLISSSPISALYPAIRRWDKKFRWANGSEDSWPDSSDQRRF